MFFYWVLFHVCKYWTLQERDSLRDVGVLTKTVLLVQNAQFSIYYLDILHFLILETIRKPYTSLHECFHAY